MNVVMGRCRIISWGVDSIVPTWINQYFQVSLTPEQEQLALQEVEELRRDGFLVKDATQRNDNFLAFTHEGKDLVEKQTNPDAHGLRLEQIIRDKNLLAQTRELFNDA